MATANDFARYVRPDVPGCPEPMILDAINQAAADFIIRAMQLETTVNVPTTANSSSAAIPLPTEREPSKIIEAKLNGIDLTLSSSDDVSVKNLTVRSGPPSHVYLDTDNTLACFPVPDAVYTISLKLCISLTKDPTSLPDLLLKQDVYRRIASGAKAILFAQANKPWSNLQQAAIEQSMFDECIAAQIVKKARGGARKPIRSKLQIY